MDITGWDSLFAFQYDYTLELRWLPSVQPPRRWQAFSGKMNPLKSR
jgi:hypothetical protein